MERALGMATPTVYELQAEIKRLRTALEKVITWLERSAEHAEKSAINNRFETMVEAYLADAKNYRATATDLRKALQQ